MWSKTYNTWQNNIDHPKEIKNMLSSMRQPCNDMCDMKDTIYDDHEDTCATMLKTLKMSVTHIYMVIPTHLWKYCPLRQTKLSFIRYVTLDMWRDEILILLQMGPKTLREKTHITSLNFYENSIQYQGRFWYLGVVHNFRGCCSSDNTWWHTHRILASLSRLILLYRV